MSTFIFDGQKVNVTFKQNKFKVWQYNASCRGERFRKSTKERTLELAEQVLEQDLEDIVKKARGIVDTTLSFEDVWNIFLKKPRSVMLTDKSKSFYHLSFFDFIAYSESKEVTSALEVTKELAEDYIHYIRKNGAFKKRYNSCKNTAIRTKNFYLTKVKAVFDAVVNEKYLKVNPFTHIPKLKGAGQESKRQIYTLEEIELMLNSPLVKKSYLYPIFLLAPYTGMRKIDICKLKSSSIDFKKNEIRYIPIKTKRYGTVAKLPIMDEIKDFLRGLDYSNKYLLPKLKEKYGTNGCLISGDFKNILTKLKIKHKEKVEGLSRSSSIKDIHSFRHNYVTMCAVAGVPMITLQEQVGHMDEAMTRLYADHVSSDDHKKAYRLVNESLKTKAGEKAPASDKKKALLAKLMELSEEDLERLLST